MKAHERLTWAAAAAGHTDIPSTSKIIATVLAYRMNSETGQLNPSIQTLSKDTNLSRTSVHRGLRGLEKVGLLKISRNVGGVRGATNSYELVIEAPVRGNASGTRTTGSTRTVDDTEGSRGRNKGVPPVVSKHSKEHRKEQRRYSEEDLALAKYMFTLVLNLSPGHRKPNFDNWASTIRLMRERDGREISEVQSLFEWANSDDFWKVNILCPAKLREKWDRLVIQKNNPSRKQSKFTPQIAPIGCV